MRTPDVTTNQQSRKAAKARADIDELADELEAESAEDTDETIDTLAGALPRKGVPKETPDTQEALYAEDGAYRVDENEGEGKRTATPTEVGVDTDGLHIITEKDL